MTLTVTTTRSIVVERTLAHPPEKVWRALTETRLLAHFLMPNDFAPVVGHEFTFTSRPMGDWDGIVHCEVLHLRAPELLRYTWAGGGSNPFRLDTVVTWTLAPEGAGTRLRMEHEGFRAENAAAYDLMSPGWVRVVDRIDPTIGAEEAGETLAPATPCKD